MNSKNSTVAVDRRALVRILSENKACEAVEELTGAIQGLLKSDVLLEKALEKLFQWIPAERGVVMLSGATSGLQPAAFRGGEFQPDPSLPERAWRKQTGILSSYPASALCAPLGDAGAIYLDSRKGNAFTMQHLMLLIAVAAEVAVPIYYTGYIETVERQIKEFREFNFVDKGIIGQSDAINKVHRFIKKVAPSDSRVLILGESGTGKDLIARAIHANSPRNAKGPFVAVNCAAITETLIESELFGHERGAFSGAIATKKGTLEIANRGTLFLDEVGELHPRTQAALLRFTEDGSFQRVGSTVTLYSDVRIIAATNRPMEEWVANGKFREDLFFRLQGIVLNTPPLRERREDIPLLAKHFLAKFRQSPLSPSGFTTAALDALKRYHWPGNVRQLHSIVEQAVVFAEKELIEPQDLPRVITEKNAGKGRSAGYAERVDVFIKDMLHTALVEADGNHAGAARTLKISPSYMRRAARKYGVTAR